MAQQPNDGYGNADDREYDLAHEATTDQPHRPAEPAPQRAPDMHASGDAGDYGHDLAHDMG